MFDFLNKINTIVTNDKTADDTSAVIKSNIMLFTHTTYYNMWYYNNTSL